MGFKTLYQLSKDFNCRFFVKYVSVFTVIHYKATPCFSCFGNVAWVNKNIYARIIRLSS